MITSYSDAVFLGLPINIYSHIMAIGVLLLLFVTILHIFAYIFSKKIREKTYNIAYFTFIKIIGVFALLSTIFALTYQWGYLLLVCELCWWQRIFMFPIDILAISAVTNKIPKIHKPILILAAFGTFFAGYHYWLHFQSWVLKSDNIMSMTSCAQGGILPSCTDPSGVVIFDFLTIPFMALVVFVFILWMGFLASKAKK